jgi:hypothetical protein
MAKNNCYILIIVIVLGHPKGGSFAFNFSVGEVWMLLRIIHSYSLCTTLNIKWALLFLILGILISNLYLVNSQLNLNTYPDISNPNCHIIWEYYITYGKSRSFKPEKELSVEVWKINCIHINHINVLKATKCLTTEISCLRVQSLICTNTNDNDLLNPEQSVPL